MDMLQQITLSAIQGITEFLPISSAGHLVLVPKLSGWADQGLMMDVAVHAGTLLAVILYFMGDIWRMLKALIFFQRKESLPYLKLIAHILIATLPIIIVGFFVKDYVALYARMIEVVGWGSIIGALILWYADSTSMTINKMDHLGPLRALFIGAWQVLAIIPGMSRAGMTMIGARFLGLERTEAARFSMLLSIPTILGAIVLLSFDMREQGVEIQAEALQMAAMTFGFAILAIWALMNWLKRANFMIFVVYRLLLGGALLYWTYFHVAS